MKIETLINTIHEGATKIKGKVEIAGIEYEATAYYVPNANIIRVDLKEIDK